MAISGMKLKVLYNHFPLVRYLKDQGLTSGREQKFKLWLRGMTSQKGTLQEYSLRGKNNDFYYSIHNDEDVGKKLVAINIFVNKSWKLKELTSIVDQAIGFNKKRQVIHAYFPLDNKLIRQFKSLGFKINAYQLMGKVSDLKSYLDSYEFDSNIKFRRLKKKNWKQAAELEYLAHKHSGSRVEIKSPRSVYDFFKLCESRKYPIFCAYENKEMVALVSPIVNKFKIGHIMTISVHPEHRGRGLSKLLYKKSLDYWKEIDVKAYSGVSNTKEVLTLSKRMKREKCAVYMELKLNS